MHFFLLECVLTKCILCFLCTSILCVCGWWDVSCCSSCFLGKYCVFSGPRHHTNTHTLPTPPRWLQPLTPTPHLQTDTSGVRLGPPWSPSRVAGPPSLDLAGGRLAHPECRPICSAGAGGLPGGGDCGKRSCPKAEPLNRSEFRSHVKGWSAQAVSAASLAKGSHAAFRVLNTTWLMPVFLSLSYPRNRRCLRLTPKGQTSPEYMSKAIF